jgi:hypothetical protein
MDIVRLWRAYQGGGFGGGYLPDAGGLNDQAAWLIDAFSILTNAEQDLKGNG